MLVASPLTDSVQAMHLQVIQNQSKWFFLFEYH
jgi:hypothetical protein